MPIIYNGKDVTEQVANGSLDTEAIAAEIREQGGMHVEGASSDEAMQKAVKELCAVFEEWLIDGPQIPLYEPRSGL